jgi:uncharacterized phage protein (TIGR02218 family)
MKPASAALLNLLNNSRQFVCTDLFILTTSIGGAYYYTTADVQITADGFTYSPFGLQISGLRYKLTNTLEADEQNITIDATQNDLIGSVPFLEAVQQGVFDGGRVVRYRAYLTDWNSPVVGTILLFTGYISTVVSLTRTSAEMKVKSDLALLDVQMPRRLYQTNCLNTLYDAGCGLSKSAFSFSGTVEAGSTLTTINWSGATSAAFWLGTVTFTTGDNISISRTIKNSNGFQLILNTPLARPCSTGDSFVATWGCDKTANTCTTKFNNFANNTSFPFVPSQVTIS